MPTTILGLDIGGANLKAATADKHAVTVPFALWKQPDRLPAALAEMVANFPDVTEFAVTMTGELCDCYETKREGVNAILDAVEIAAKQRAIRVWSTDCGFVSVAEARREHMKVAASNWHALATFAGRLAPSEGGLLLDIGSTTTDIIPLTQGVPHTHGTTDAGRLAAQELVYAGVRRTPISAVFHDRIASEYFASTQDVYLVLGLLEEESANRETADNRPATVEFALSRLARMLGADRETLDEEAIIAFATRVHGQLLGQIVGAARAVYYDSKVVPELHSLIVSGAGEFLARRVVEKAFPEFSVSKIISLNEVLGPVVSACAPAYALAVLAAETHA